MKSSFISAIASYAAVLMYIHLIFVPLFFGIISFPFTIPPSLEAFLVIGGIFILPMIVGATSYVFLSGYFNNRIMPPVFVFGFYIVIFQMANYIASAIVSQLLNSDGFEFGSVEYAVYAAAHGLLIMMMLYVIRPRAAHQVS